MYHDGVQWRRSPTNTKDYTLAIYRIHFPHQVIIQRTVGIPQLLLQPKKIITQLWKHTPWADFILTQIQLIPDYSQTIGTLVDNYDDMDFTVSDLPSESSIFSDLCPCHLIPRAQKFMDDSVHHIRTMDCNIVKWDHPIGKRFFYQMFKFGRNFRPSWPKETFIQKTTEFFTQLLDLSFGLLKHYSSDNTEFWRHRKIMLTTFNPLRDRILADLRITESLIDLRLHRNVVQHIRHMQKVLTFTRTDKAENNSFMVCTNYYRYNLMRRLSSLEFERIDLDSNPHLSLDSTLQRIHDLVQVKSTSKNYPPLCSSEKAKKLLDPSTSLADKKSIKMSRFILCAQDSPHKPLSALLSFIYKNVHTTFQHFCTAQSLTLQEKIGGLPIRFCWTADSMEVLANLPNNAYSLWKGDHSRMFECLPHLGNGSIRSAQLFLFQKALHHKHAHCLHISRNLRHAHGLALNHTQASLMQRMGE